MLDPFFLAGDVHHRAVPLPTIILVANTSRFGVVLHLAVVRPTAHVHFKAPVNRCNWNAGVNRKIARGRHRNTVVLPGLKGSRRPDL